MGIGVTPDMASLESRSLSNTAFHFHHDGKDLGIVDTKLAVTLTREQPFRSLTDVATTWTAWLARWLSDSIAYEKGQRRCPQEEARMSGSKTHDDQMEFIDLRVIAAEAAIPMHTLRRRLRQQGIQLWADQRDQRRRLIRAEDYHGLLAPKPIGARAA